MMLTGRGRAWMRSDLGGDGRAQRRALWWPPTKIAGRYLSPYLAALRGADPIDAAARPDGHPVELDLERELPSAADTLPQASPPREHQRARPAPRRAEARRDPRRPLLPLKGRPRSPEISSTDRAWTERRRRPSNIYPLIV
jgi:hypothetical protein